MVTLVKNISTEILNTGHRIIKCFRLGKTVQTATQAGPWGVDSNPVKDAIAIYVESGKRGAPVIIGYLNTNAIADVGEHRLFSTDGNGALKFYLHLKADGTCEIGGDADNMVRYSPMAAVSNEHKASINELKQLISGWTPTPNDGGAALKAILASWSGQQLTEDISAAKIDEVKTL